ncbi:MAG: PadR family transcriptional regulator [Myxococcota bacterium]
MSLRHAILGFLSVRPFTGYDLKKAFDTSIRHFWTADKAAIYRMLADLESDGLAASERVPQQTRPDRHLYHLTDAGRIELDRWLRVPLEPVTRREPFLLQLFFSDRLSPAERDEVVAAELAATEEQVGALSAVVALVQGDPNQPLGPILTLHAGLVSLIGWRDWLRAIRARLGEPGLAASLLAEFGGRPNE